MSRAAAIMRWLAGLVALFCCASAFALGLGEVEGRAVIGRPLQISIPILGVATDFAGDVCPVLLPDGDGDGIRGIRLRVAGGRVHLSTAWALTQPILQFGLRLGCSGFVERSFMVLPEPPQSTDAVRDTDRPSLTPPATGDSSLPRRAATLASADSGLELASATSLRMLSRQRYPRDSRLRVQFIRHVAAANPDLFASEQAAFDQRLAAGTRLVIPAGLPAPHASPAVRKQAAAPVSLPRAGGNDNARGRLIVGAAGLSDKLEPSQAELNESIDRLISVMNQQIEVQMAQTQRIKAVEAELVELKRQALVEQHRAKELESQLKSARDQVDRGEMIQLVLVILLGGLCGAWGLQWLARRKATRADLAPPAAVSPALTFEPARPAAPIASVFEDLFEPADQRDEILPPNGSRHD